MKTWLIRGVLVLLASAASWALVVWSGVLPRTTDAQRQALVSLRAPLENAHGQRNAFDLFWLIDYDIPEDQRAAVIAEDSAALSADPNAADGIPSQREERFPRRVPKDAPTVERCAPDCLAIVRADTQTWRDALAAQQPRLLALRELGSYDHNRSPFPLNFATPIPPYQNTGLLQLAEAALEHVDGDSEAALTGLCRDIAGWRGLKGRSDSLVAEMVGIATLQASARLYADIRAELPLGTPMPPACEASFAPLTVEQRVGCDVIRTEFALIDTAFSNLDRDPYWADESPLRTLPGRWLFNPEATLAAAAPGYLEVCQLPMLPIAEWRAAQTPVENWCGWQDHLFNPFGCDIIEMAIPAFGDYFRRDRDAEGTFLLLQLADWLAAQDDADAAFAARPETFRVFEQDVRFENGELSLDLLEPRQGDPRQWRIALPGSRVPATTDSASEGSYAP